MNAMNRDTITLGGGCFWCTEAVYLRLNGVVSVVSGYAGGNVKNPSYKEVCAGTTGHAEVVQVVFDPAVISLDQLLDIFWEVHDPTTLNRQGNDIGTQYRSVIFYMNKAQKLVAEKQKEELMLSGKFKQPIVTEISPLVNFFPAEDYHQDYYNQNAAQPYCSFVISPKIIKMEKKFPALLKISK